MLLALVLASSACVDMSDDGLSTGSTEQAVGTHNRLATNRLATNRLATNRLATNRLATNSLNGLAALADTSDILSQPDGPEVYSYVVSCALPADVVIHATIPNAADTAPDANYKCVGGECEFYGNLGLTPDWLDKKLDHAGKGWISACLFSRCNANDKAEAISLRGRNPALAVSPDEATIFPVQEGAFYGNVFIDDPDPSVPPDWYACRGQGQASGEFGGLVARDCAEPNPANPTITLCGFHYAGDCADYTPEVPSGYACSGQEGGAFNDCHQDAGNASGHWPNANHKFRQVITSYVTN
jgi:hypothetical protein